MLLPVTVLPVTVLPVTVFPVTVFPVTVVTLLELTASSFIASDTFPLSPGSITAEPYLPINSTVPFVLFLTFALAPSFLVVTVLPSAPFLKITSTFAYTETFVRTEDLSAALLAVISTGIGSLTLPFIISVEAALTATDETLAPPDADEVLQSLISEAST